MRIAILDPRIQVPGLKCIFPEADYFITRDNKNGYDLNKTPDHFYGLYNFHYREDIEYVTDKNYDILMIVYCITDFNDKNRLDSQYHLNILLNKIDSNKFKKLIFINNNDDDADPFVECPYLKMDLCFQRNYSKMIQYHPSVIPFSFCIFGPICPLWKILNINYEVTEKIDRVLWAGAVYGNRIPIYNAVRHYLQSIQVPNHLYLEELSKSKFALDLDGCGHPNIKTLEILCANSLLVQQYKHINWGFDEGDAFSEETTFKTPEEFMANIDRLRADQDLYDRCLANQKYIKHKYFNRDWLRQYILQFINE
jgi:hypothetical protein